MRPIFIMLKIYAIPVSLYCAKLRILLRNKQLRWQELPPPGGYGSDEYKLIIPSGNLPALADGELMLGDSEAIGEYLNEKYPEPPMLPTDMNERAKVRELSRFHDTRLEPELRKLFSYIDPANRDRAKIEHQANAISQRLGQLAKMLDHNIFHTTDGPTLADCGFPISFAWLEQLMPIMDMSVNWPEPVSSYSKRISQHPPIAAELGDYRPKLIRYLQTRITQ
jgi:glutathione S-transferase